MIHISTSTIMEKSNMFDEDPSVISEFWQKLFILHASMRVCSGFIILLFIHMMHSFILILN